MVLLWVGVFVIMVLGHNTMLPYCTTIAALRTEVLLLFKLRAPAKVLLRAEFLILADESWFSGTIPCFPISGQLRSRIRAISKKISTYSYYRIIKCILSGIDEKRKV